MPDHRHPSSATFYASCAAGLEALLADEIRATGANSVRQAGAGVSFDGGLEQAYRACLWSRVANRILMPIADGMAETPESLYALVQRTDWSQHLGVDDTLAVDFYTAASRITHSQYGALKVKDAVVDQFRQRYGRRPSVEREQPSVRINVYLHRNRARLAIDLSGSSLHRRGYRPAGGGAAPLKENLAAGLLLAIDWPAQAKRGAAFVDPLCGSGTLVIEAGLMAGHRAPGLLRDYFGFQGWLGHDAGLWSDLQSEARAQARPLPLTLYGFDRDERVIALARDCSARAGLGTELRFAAAAVQDGRPDCVPDSAQGGVLLSNPPYGERLAADGDFFAQLGQGLSEYAGWECGLIVAVDAPLAQARLPLQPRLQVRNGGIDCVFTRGTIPARRARRPASTHAAVSVWPDADPPAAAGTAPAPAADPGSPWPVPVAAEPVDLQPFINRLKKNLRTLKGWRRQQGIRAFRAYDADLPEFAVAIDIYDCSTRHVVIQEYRAPVTVNAALASARLEGLMEALPAVLEVAPERLHLRLRERQAGARQYQRQQSARIIDTLEEGGVRYEINFSDYLDTGLFLDHRAVRRYVLQHCRGLRFLNLFAYTGSVSAAAVVGGARETVSVDLSRHYGDWARRNLAANGADPGRHVVIRDDVSQWLAAAQDTELFDLILLDPPTFSNSTATENDWNVQRDHVAAIDAAMRLLHPSGLLIFSTNYRRFRLDESLSGDGRPAAADTPVDGMTGEPGDGPDDASARRRAGRDGGGPTAAAGGHRGSGSGQPAARQYEIRDRSAWSIDRDFKRNQRIHRCWFIQHISRE